MFHGEIQARTTDPSTCISVAYLYIFLELDTLLHADHAGADVQAEVGEHGRVLEPGI